jgi:hypothetical protein
MRSHYNLSWYPPHSKMSRLQVMKTASGSAESQQLAAEAAAMSQQLIAVKSHMLQLTTELSWLQDSLTAFEPDVSYKAAVHWLDQQLTPATKLAIAQHLATFDRDSAGATAIAAKAVTSSPSKQQVKQLEPYLAAAMEACLVRVAAVRSANVVKQLMQLPCSSLFTAFLLKGAARLLVYGEQPGVYKAAVSCSSSSITSSAGASVDINALLLAAVPYAVAAERQHKESRAKAAIVATVLHRSTGGAGDAISADGGVVSIGGSRGIPMSWAEALEAVAEADAAARQALAAKYSSSSDGTNSSIVNSRSASPTKGEIAAKLRLGSAKPSDSNSNITANNTGYAQQLKAKMGQAPGVAQLEQQLSNAALQQLLRAVYWLGPDYKLARSLLKSDAESAMTEEVIEAVRNAAQQQCAGTAAAAAACTPAAAAPAAAIGIKA